VCRFTKDDEPEATSTPSAVIDEISDEEFEQSLNECKIEKQLDQMD